MKGKAAAAKTLSLDNESYTIVGVMPQKFVGVAGFGRLCIQVLMSARKTWEEEKKSLTFSKMSDALMKTMQLSGVNYELMLAKESNS